MARALGPRPARAAPVIALTTRGWWCAATAVVLGCSWWAIGLRDVWQFAAVFAALVVVAVIASLLLAQLARPQVTLRVDDRARPVGSDIALSVRITHRLPIRALAQVEWRIGSELALSAVELRPGESVRASHGGIATHRGALPVAVAALRLSDPLGLAIARTRCRAASEVLVLPELFPEWHALVDAAASAREGHGEAPFAASRRSGDGAESGGSLREYRTGDAPRQINWKKSARQGELLVNLPDATALPLRSIRLDRDPAAYANADDFERAVSATATAVTLWAEQGLAVDLQLGDDTHLSAPATRGAPGIPQYLRALATVALSGAVSQRPSTGGAANDGREVEGGFGQPLASERRPGVHGGSIPDPSVVVTGALQARLHETLAELPGGSLLVTRGSIDAPAGWDTLTIPSRT